MTKRFDVGHSERTPAKHGLMCGFYGREVGVINGSQFHRDIERLCWIDLTAGDAVVADGAPWHINCSPGINAYYATGSNKAVDVTLYEIKPATFERLLGSLAEHLPNLGYERSSKTEWVIGDRVTLRAVLGSGTNAAVDHIRRTDAVLVSNDPNAITDCAMRPTFATELHQRAWCFRSLSTLGCNVGGLLRIDPATRAHWFELMRQQVRALPRYRDLFLAAIEGDRSKWAYLLSEPVKWRTANKAMVKSAFGKSGYSMETAWLRTERDAFVDLTHRLFMTRRERNAS